MTAYAAKPLSFKPIAEPYYQIEFSIDLSALCIQAGDTIQLEHYTLTTACLLPIMHSYPDKNTCVCLLKDEKQKTIINLIHSENSFFSYTPLPTQKVYSEQKHLLIIAQNEYLASLILHAGLIPKQHRHKVLTLFEIDGLCVFPIRPSSFIIPALNPSATACLPLLEDWGIPSRIASKTEQTGCHPGTAFELATTWLNSDDAKKDMCTLSVYGPREFIETFKKLENVMP